jgi:hypothetical protein
LGREIGSKKAEQNAIAILFLIYNDKNDGEQTFFVMPHSMRMGLKSSDKDIY